MAGCYGRGCGSEVMIFFMSLIVYGGAAIVLLVLLSVRRWRRSGLRVLPVVVGLAILLPLLTQGWVALKVARLEAAEVRGSPPPMTERMPLLIDLSNVCSTDQCKAAVHGRGDSGILYVRGSDLKDLDPDTPVLLTELPMHRLTRDARGLSDQVQRLTSDERRGAATDIDYVIIAGTSFRSYWPRTPVNEALARNPQVKGLWGDVRLTLAMAPLDQGKGVIDFAALKFDVLDLWLQDRSLELPLMLGSLRSTDGRITDRDGIARSLCPPSGEVPGWDCRSLDD